MLKHHSLIEFTRFLLVGLLNTGIDVVLFFLLTFAGIPYVAAQVFSYSCGTANSYVLNKVWTFRSNGRSLPEIARFISVNLASLGISIIFLTLLHDRLGWKLTVAKAGATVAALAVNFLGNKLWVFK